ncbi:hypothetical protein with DUF543 [Prunus dulcis]|uniref:MICOS complex subunit MIC10 n=1 Tax=Prunus dulcis TaxID=3755 RepID=A0A4Y1QW18_PRUDU|nr:hypothetical protein with DUF543 [Prunus dulcis]
MEIHNLRYVGPQFTCHIPVTGRSPVSRWASVAFGAGLGIGSAYTECSRLFEGSPAKLAAPKIIETPAPQDFRKSKTTKTLFLSQVQNQCTLVFSSLWSIWPLNTTWSSMTISYSAMLLFTIHGRSIIDNEEYNKGREQ